MVEDESGSGRREWKEKDPHGVPYRVVIAPRGTSLRGGSVASGVIEIVIELLVSAFASSLAEDGTFKVGVLRRRWGIERFVLKERLPDEKAAVVKAARIRNEIRRGGLTEVTG